MLAPDFRLRTTSAGQLGSRVRTFARPLPAPGSRCSRPALLAITASWGSTFFLIQDLLDRMPTLDFLAVRFAIAAS